MPVTFTTSGALKKSALREANERLVLNTIRQNPSLSRADIVRITGLSPSSVTFIVKRLKADDIICEFKTENWSQVGRLPTAIRLRTNARVGIGVELGLAGGRIVVADLSDAIVSRKTVPWHANHGVFLDKVRKAILGLAAQYEPDQVLGIGVALPGFIDRATGRVIAAENVQWFGVEVGETLRRDIDIPIYFENGAKLSALAEMWSADGQRKPLRDFVSVIARGGLGTGVIINGEILQGATFGASEFGHIPIFPGGRKCSCGNTGCWEQYASDFAFTRLYCERAQLAPDQEVEPEEIIAKVRAGDATAAEVLRETAHNVGLGFVNLVMALNPQLIVVGDYLADAWDLMEETVWSVLRSRVPSYYLSEIRILPSCHRADAPLAGAVALVLSRFFNSFEDGGDKGRQRSVLMKEA
ncbi:ROK family transcriptional regulator [uncultured Paludibaculum sp.]|uniref:ROK family transcriptional regulator n=1 Tax=uncultured Paludibaculum sp. TaxID=1765020 RepID=UPI002AAB98B3|nr:ROK family transcriptional regulator [uncultured Paludibaculum sp.]